MREDFLRTFANVPVGMRREIVYLSKEHGPMSWYACWLEVDQKTPLGDELCATLKGMQLI